MLDAALRMDAFKSKGDSSEIKGGWFGTYSCLETSEIEKIMIMLKYTHDRKPNDAHAKYDIHLT